MNQDAVPKAWLEERVTIAVAEAENPGPADNPVAFGGLAKAWKELLAQMQPGDELWNFASPAESWRNLAGRAGIAVVRDGVVVAVMVTLMN